MPQLDLTTYSSQIFWLILCLIVLYLSMRYVFIPKMQKIINDRDSKVQDLLNQAHALVHSTAVMSEEYNSQIRSARFEAARQRDQKMIEFEKWAQDQLDHTNKESEKTLKEARDKLAIEKESMQCELDGVINKIVDPLLAIIVSGVAKK